MESRLSRWCDGLLEAGWLVAILATPIFFNIHSERVFEPDKLALLRSIALIMAAVWLVGLIDRRGWRNLARLRPSDPTAIWHRPLVLPVVALVVVYVLATLFSIAPRVSWAGSYQRLQGTYTTLSYVVIFAMMAATLRTPQQVRRVVSTAIVAGIPVALYGLLQHFGHDPLPWGGNVQERVAGNMGNAIFIAAYLIMVVPLTLARVVDAVGAILGDERLSVADVARAAVYLFILALQLLTIYWSGSRGPLIGLAVGLFSFTLVLLVSLRGAGEGRRGRDALLGLAFLLPALLALLLSPVVSAAAGPAVAFGFFMGVVVLSVVAIFVLVALRRGWRWLWLAWIALTVFMAGWLLLFNVPADRTAGLRGAPLVGGVLDVLDEWRDLPTIGSYGRMLDPTNTTGREKSGRVRVLIWEGVIDLISPHTPLTYPDGRSDPFNWLRPLLGYGPETMYVAYNRFYPPELATVEARNASPDRSHNETFDTLVITGLLGLLAWQALYLSVLLFAFRYLGVVHSRRDAAVLIGLWIGGAVLAAVVALLLAGPIYLGVAVPIGVILGVVAYLIYHAVFGRAAPDAAEIRPFAPDRLLMNALVAAVLAHYVEIHFGIAISATRLYFFAYAALMLALAGARAVQTTPAPVEASPAARPEKRRRKAATTAAPATPAAPGAWLGLLVPGLLLTLMLGILGYNFISYALPPGKVIEGPADLTAGEIFRQSLTQNARAEFIDSPFVLTLLVLAWGLGWLVFLSEMAKHGELRLPAMGGGSGGRQRAAAGVLLALAVAGVAARFVASGATLTAALGQNAALIGAAVCAAAAAFLLLDRPRARPAGAMVGVALLALAWPVLVAGGVVPAVVMLLGSAALLWLLWDGRAGEALLPVAIVVPASLPAGLAAIFVHATRYKAMLFYQGNTAAQSAAELRALEAGQVGALLVGFYVFLFLMLAALSLALSWPGLTESRRPWSDAPRPLAFGALAVLLVAALFLGARSNVRGVQADMIYKRAKPHDDQATRATGADPAARRQVWDTAIAIYERAIDRAPEEDFYYLFLGRALLERAGLSEDADERTELLTRAETLLLRAQDIAPLNTDHTANLARLNARWVAATDDPTERNERLDLAGGYYVDALALSPQNSVVRNELARLVLEVVGDCERALAVYDDSALVDPFYAQTHLARADAYIVCGDPLPEAERTERFRVAAEALDTALLLSPANIRAWIQLAEVRRQLGEYEAADAALAQARLLNEPVIIPTAELDFLAAQIAAGRGDEDEARRLALGALVTAGDTTAKLIEEFLAGLD
jgi:tetratricopeptide (TPR) repeat protein